MAWTTDDIETLEAAIASGILTVTYSGPPSRMVQYQNTDAMLKALAQMRKEVNGTPSYRLVQTKMGFRDE